MSFSDIQEFYEVTLLDESKTVQQKTAETLLIASKWEHENTIKMTDVSRYSVEFSLSFSRDIFDVFFLVLQLTKIFWILSFKSSNFLPSFRMFLDKWLHIATYTSFYESKRTKSTWSNGQSGKVLVFLLTENWKLLLLSARDSLRISLENLVDIFSVFLKVFRNFPWLIY